MTYIQYVPRSCRKGEKTISINNAAIIIINCTTHEPLESGPNPMPYFTVYIKISLCRPGGVAHANQTHPYKKIDIDHFVSKNTQHCHREISDLTGRKISPFLLAIEDR